MFYLKKQKGFTIVETMIVLAVTGVLFFSVSLLISGQTERYRYRDSMYRLQQQVQNVINDTQNGNLAKDINTGGTDNVVIKGKRFIFCAPDSPNRDLEGCRDAIYRNGKIFRTELMKDDNGNVSGYTPSINVVNIPDGIEFIEAKSITTDGVAHPFGKHFGVTASFNDSNNVKDIELRDIWAWWPLSNFETAPYFIKSFLLCFEGYKKGSLEFGSKELGNTVKLNLVDDRCN